MLYILLVVAASLVLLAAQFGLLLAQYIYDTKRLRRFHNFSKLPGITNLPWIWASIRLRRFKDLHEAHRDATIVRVGPNTLSFNDPRAAAAIYGHGSPATKAPYYDSGAGHYRNLADTRDKQEHSKKRRILASGYALTTLLRWEDKVVNRIQALVKQYDERCLPKDSAGTTTAISLDHRRWMSSQSTSSTILASALISNYWRKVMTFSKCRTQRVAHTSAASGNRYGRGLKFTHHSLGCRNGTTF